MTKTPDLIDELVGSAAPVRRLRHPLLRAGLWVLFAFVLLGLLSLGNGIRADLSQRLYQPGFLIAMFSALTTGILAAITAFKISVPGNSRSWLLLPIPALAIWVSTIGYGCLTDWVNIGPNGIRLGEAARCFSTLLLTSMPLSIAMLIMLRYTAALRPLAVSIIGSLAVAAFTSFALSLIHDLDATMMILIWNLGSAMVIVLLGSTFGQMLFVWTATRLLPQGSGIRTDPELDR